MKWKTFRLRTILFLSLFISEGPPVGYSYLSPVLVSGDWLMIGRVFMRVQSYAEDRMTQALNSCQV